MKIAIYSKKNCKVCSDAKKKMSYFNVNEVAKLEDWKNNTWIERDASAVISGTIPQWRNFPDTEVLAFIAFENTDVIPIFWIDGKVFYYSEAMKYLKLNAEPKSRTIQLESPAPVEQELEVAIA
jgi:hypothetical protein